MSGGSRRPVPVPDELSAPYWRGAGDHVLVLARCSRCGRFAHPPDVVCPYCNSTDPSFAFTPVDGVGTIRSWTVMHQSFLPGFDDDLPFVLVDVELANQPEVRLIGRLMDGPQAALQSGAPVRLAWEDLGLGVSVPAFALAEKR